MFYIHVFLAFKISALYIKKKPNIVGLFVFENRKDYLFENWYLALAPRRPDFCLSTFLGSRVTNPAASSISPYAADFPLVYSVNPETQAQFNTNNFTFPGSNFNTPSFTEAAQFNFGNSISGIPMNVANAAGRSVFNNSAGAAGGNGSAGAAGAAGASGNGSSGSRTP